MYWIIGAALGLVVTLVFCCVQLRDIPKKSPLKKKLKAIRMAPVIFFVLLIVGVPLLVIGVGALVYLFLKAKLKRRRPATATRPIPDSSPVP
jgi:flagellar basal body-associated protein FliL